MTSTANRLEDWLRKQAAEQAQAAASRRLYAHAGDGLDDREKGLAHGLAERMAGKRLKKWSAEEEVQASSVQDRIADKLDQQSAMLTEFADWVAQQGGKG